MNRKTLLVFGAIAAVILIIVTVVLSLLGAPKSYTLSQPAALNLRYTHQVNSTTLDYYNGSAFMQTDLLGQKPKALTSNLQLPNVTAIHWGKGGALFRASNYGGSDQLTPLLDARHLPIDAPYWWYIDFTTSAISLVGTPTGTSPGINVDDAIWNQTGDTFVFIQTSGHADAAPTTTLYTATAATPQGTAVITTDATKLLWTDGTKLVYIVDNQDTHTLARMTIASKAVQTLVKPFNGTAAVSPDGSQVLALVGGTSSEESLNTGSGTLQFIDSSGVSKVITKSFAGTLAWDPNGSNWTAVNTAASHGYYGTSQSIKQLSIGKGKNEIAPTDMKLVGLSADTLLLTDSQNTGYLASQKLPNTTVVYPPNNASVNYTGTDTLIGRGLSEDQLNDFKYAMLQYLGSQGVSAEVISVTNISKVPHDRLSASTTETFNFTVTVNSNKTYSAKLDYFDLDSATLTLTQPGKSEVVYTSGIITPANH